MDQELKDFTSYIYRGQAREDWTLQSTLDRLEESVPESRRSLIRQKQLNGFKLATRGRRGPSPPSLDNENELWALGQHYGLATPLLDFTESPFVALYFAFLEDGHEDSGYRVVYALSEVSVASMRTILAADHALKMLDGESESSQGGPLLGSRIGLGQQPASRLGGEQGPPAPPVVDVIRPMSDENSRLVNQRGLFVNGPEGLSIEDWIGDNSEGTNSVVLFKIRIPNRDRGRCLQFLNRMNINHLSLFPDLYGASRYCNMDLQIKNY